MRANAPGEGFGLVHVEGHTDLEHACTPRAVGCAHDVGRGSPGERITGSIALRTLFQTIMATFDSNLTLHSQNLETSGDLAYDSGDFHEILTTIANGAKIATKSSYIIIFKRQPNGSWQIVQHVWTGTPPPGT